MTDGRNGGDDDDAVDDDEEDDRCCLELDDRRDGFLAWGTGEQARCEIDLFKTFATLSSSTVGIPHRMTTRSCRQKRGGEIAQITCQHSTILDGDEC